MMREANYRTGTVAQAMERERARVLREQPHPLGPNHWATRSAHMTYSGGEVSQFSAFMRWSTDGQRAVVSSISGVVERRGRMPVIMAALEALCATVDVENVVNRHLLPWLHRNDYRPVHAGPGPAPWPYTMRKMRGVTGVDFYEPLMAPYSPASAPGAPEQENAR